MQQRRRRSNLFLSFDVRPAQISIALMNIIAIVSLINMKVIDPKAFIQSVGTTSKPYNQTSHLRQQSNSPLSPSGVSVSSSTPTSSPTSTPQTLATSAPTLTPSKAHSRIFFMECQKNDNSKSCDTSSLLSKAQTQIQHNRTVWEDPDSYARRINPLSDTSADYVVDKKNVQIPLTSDRKGYIDGLGKVHPIVQDEYPTYKNYINMDQAMKMYENDVSEECVPKASWHALNFPTCNIMHESDLNHGIVKMLNRGEYRDVWSFDTNYKDQRVALKTLRIDESKADRFVPKRYELHRLDALVTERLTSSPYSMKIHSFCGQSTFNSMAADGGTNAITQYNGDDGEHLSNLQRLKYARDVSRAIADLHSIDGEDVVTFIHRDIRSSNFLIDFTGRMVVHDFNLSKLVHWNPKTKQQCGFVKPACTEVRAPEECWGKPLTEKIDVFALGSVIYFILTGYKPFSYPKQYSHSQIQQKASKGRIPELPSSVKKSEHKAVIAMREVIGKCYTFDPEERPTAREIADLFDQTLRELGEYDDE